MASTASALTTTTTSSSIVANPFLYLRRSHISHFTSNFSLHSFSRSGSRVCLSNNAKISSCLCHDYRVKFKRFECRAEDSYTNNKEISKGTLIWRAIKLPIYSVALVPLTVGSAAAYLQTGLFSARQYFTLLASSVLIIAWLNLSNDVYDFDTGADKNKKESVVNMVGSRTGTHAAAYALLALGFVGLSWASMVAGNFRAILLLACAVICGYIYQCPPFRLSYQGLGEPLCFAAFGPFATTAFYLMQTATSEMISPLVTATVLSASLLVGFTTTLILFCSHFHQVEGDRAVGKMSPLFSCALTIPLAKLVVSYVEDNHKDNSKIFMAKYYCVRLHALFGAALAAGLVAARLLTKR
ncbi:hypothetical protein PVL29_003778 [Vitis rotundifolia]|uniref:2-carboxy-1,4-naphthoquinone phytyltransferase, chloroplastic n=1 Tax=Vitis rotundifolia TaxID=103349 RepID=A0AA39AEZ8_VITRO|nr:hypothetical protein PVL29_003778 [Vitis rotundifolia]